MTEKIVSSSVTFMVGLDRRIDFCRELVGTGNEPSALERSEAARLMNTVFDGVKRAIEFGLPKSCVAIWADTDLGEAVLLRARAMSLATAVSTDRGDMAGAPELNPARTWDLATMLDAEFAAARINYNPDSPQHVREAEQASLLRLARKCRRGNRSMLIELSTAPTRRQIEKTGGYEQARTMVLLETMRQLQDAGVEPAVWAMEPPGDRTAAAALAAQAHIDERHDVAVLFTTGSEPDPSDDSKYPAGDEEAIARLAARTPGATGLLIGPKTYFSHLALLQKGSTGRDEAADAIARRLHSLYRIFSDARTTASIS